MHPKTFIHIALSFGVFSASSVLAETIPKGFAVEPFTPEIKQGQYVWFPELSPAGPVVIIVSLPEQLLYVYRNGVRIGRSSVSSGKAGHRTPTGAFTVLQKAVKHTSTIYKGASMPYMERLTWGGVALHAGNLPGYPAAHGCVRMPLDFARQLYSVTTNGTTVIVTNSRPSTGRNGAPGLLFAATPGQVARPGGVAWTPEQAPVGPISIIVSSSDGTAYVYRNGIEIGRAPVGGLVGLKGWHVYSALATLDAGGHREWFSTAGDSGAAPEIADLLKQVSVDPQFLANVRERINPGTTMILTDAPVNISTRSDKDFNILTTGQTP